MIIKNSAVDWPTVLKALAGGGLLGAGLGATTTLLSHLRNLQEKAQHSAHPEDDSNVVYLNLRQPDVMAKHSSANNAWTFALSGLGGLAGIYGAYNLVRGMHQSIRKKQLEKELQSSQQIYLDNLGTMRGLQKRAGGQFSTLTGGIGSIYLASLLTALGSGVVANRVLQKQFPPIKDPNRDRPKRIVIRSVGAGNAPMGEEQVVKPKDESPEAVEALLRTQLGNHKAAAVSGFADLVNAAAAGKCAAIKEALWQEDCDNWGLLLSMVNGDRHLKTSSVDRNLAVSWLAHDPLVSSSLTPLLAAEFNDWAPSMMKLAGIIDRDSHEFGTALVGFSEAVTRQMRKGAYAKVLAHVKQAEHELPAPFKAVFMADAIKKLMENGHTGELQVDRDNNVTPSSDSQDFPGVDLEVDDATAARFAHRNHNLLENSVSI